VSNQGGNFVQGLTDHKKTKEVNDRTNELVGNVFSDILYCPHLPIDHKSLKYLKVVDSSYITDCTCRKPKVGMGLTVLSREGVGRNSDLGRVFMVGERPEDNGFADYLGIKFFHIDVFLAFGKDKDEGLVSDSKEYRDLEEQFQIFFRERLDRQRRKFPYWILDRIFSQ